MESCDSAKSPRQLSTDKWGWESWGWPLWESWLSEIQPVLGAPRETDLTAHSGWPGCWEVSSGWPRKVQSWTPRLEPRLDQCGLLGCPTCEWPVSLSKISQWQHGWQAQVGGNGDCSWRSCGWGRHWSCWSGYGPGSTCLRAGPGCSDHWCCCLVAEPCPTLLQSCGL